MTKNLKTLLLGFTGGVLGALLIFQLLPPTSEQNISNNNNLTPAFAAYEVDRLPEEKISKLPGENFVKASKLSTESVVYIKTVSERYGRTSWLELWLGGGGAMQQVGSGSGVIFKENGYILTNNHVIDDADKIEVVIKKRIYEAKLVGRDPSTDLAILKIDANNLPAIQIGSSKNVEVGEWVLAVGNPFNLNSTVTAGIVSAKGRELNILKSNFPIESFIQTDAAINPGNSGGALVNAEGELVGINTAIISQTGSYAGYGFAVPIDIAKKIANDIIEYGAVQKAFMGADVTALTPENADKLGTDDLDGVVVSYLQQKGAAEKANIQKGDIIRSINGEKISSNADFEEKLSLRSPGDKLYLTIERKNKTLEKQLVLTNSENTTQLLKRDAFFSNSLGAEFEAVPKMEQNLLNISSGVRVVDVKNGFFSRLNIDEGFIITEINGNEVSDPKKLAEILEEIKGKVIIKGINKKGIKGYYSFYF
ncbi:trypsin-like peptidase domain-containing protein [Marivirga atlantica]|jgi:Do/DeqQ family serine protease|uniref:Trypsin-like peptidase domain-containing protein n=1 Tax=Marivirga atlantica TaxID=1548457 RepID=A0A937APX1_9BACT|nr:trypsin-like peptidase domain-containing protein [Marivirga atlantica]MBL0766647.1 trypsin-like peptidase domain-containing protein [Marivirga atlantica]